ncbi:hypothetical protein V6M85_00060 [Sulfolobus tengchongensis]|uniref:Uncharacterized protein n=1 Tax=Sulfolobus tengchongensis TaxID=207809 RepID=A0AAX4L2X2_9CREN
MGDYRSAYELATQCVQLLSDSIKIRNKIKNVLKSVDMEFKIPEKLREEGITSADLIQIALYYLAKKFSVRTENNMHLFTVDDIKLSIIDTYTNKEIRGYCENCKGYRYVLLTNARGFFIIYDKIIYGEFNEGNENDVIKEIIKNAKL